MQSFWHCYQEVLSRGGKSALSIGMLLGLVSCGPPAQPVPKDYVIPTGDPTVMSVSRSISPNDERFTYTYRMGERDEVRITVERFSEFSTSGAIDEKGQIRLPKLEGDAGLVRLQGLTVEEGQVKIKKMLGSKYCLFEPTVKIDVIATPSKEYYVIGGVIEQVKRFTMGPHPVTIKDVFLGGGVESSGGASDYLAEDYDLDHVKLITVDPDKPTYVEINVRRILWGETRENFNIHPGDIVFVPSTAWASWTRVWGRFVGRVEAMKADREAMRDKARYLTSVNYANILAKEYTRESKIPDVGGLRDK